MYSGYITKLKNVQKHPNADRLKIAECFGNQVIVSLEYQDGDMGVYFPTDGQLGEEYCKANNLLKSQGGYLDDKKRHVRTLKLRGAVSDGLFMPLSSLESFTDISKLKEGFLVTELDGVLICKKYIPQTNKENRASNRANNINKNKEKRKLDNAFPHFFRHKDTSQLRYNLHRFNVGDICYLTLKMHGTSGRTGYMLKKDYSKKTILDKILKRPKKVVRFWDYVSGSRKVILNTENVDGGYYNDNNFRIKYHELFEGKLRKGETVYYEIVGYIGGNNPIMAIANNHKTKDKNFIKEYGDTTVFNYGCNEGENDIYIYRMTMVSEEGVEIDYPWDYVKKRAEQMGIKTVMELDRFIYTTEKDLLDRVEKFVDGRDPVGKTHIREGIVIRIEGQENFTAFKDKNTTFKILEGIIKDDGVVDMEEQESEEGEEDA